MEKSAWSAVSVTVRVTEVAKPSVSWAKAAQVESRNRGRSLIHPDCDTNGPYETEAEVSYIPIVTRMGHIGRQCGLEQRSQDYRFDSALHFTLNRKHPESK